LLTETDPVSEFTEIADGASDDENVGMHKDRGFIGVAPLVSVILKSPSTES
jgi:hypothetical protein